MELTISTGNYMDELIDWINKYNYNNIVDKFEIVDNNCFVTINGSKSISAEIIELFEIIILDKNKVANSHDKLKQILKAIVFEPGRKEMKNDFSRYIKENSHVNLEGFVDFRLSKYSSMVNLVLYAAVKRTLY
ncbi:putative sporulation protein YtxC [Tyzzerella sp. OttesenSCG-928-J15]|nr:putative sporulation protein YtxC [Tyzzerella sp. OttesenSCG-928-J15]